jgi:hypothetical protein
MRAKRSLVLFSALVSSIVALAQSPELSIRAIAADEIVLGIRAVAIGSDAAVAGNPALTFHETGTASIDVALARFKGGNTFTSVIVEATTPAFAYGLTIRIAGATSDASSTQLSLASIAVPGTYKGGGNSRGFWITAAMPLGAGFSAGLVAAYDVAEFSATAPGNGGFATYQTQWWPTGGLGLTWQPDPHLVVGAQASIATDTEVRVDAAGTVQGLDRDDAFSLGAAGSLWPGGLVELGGSYTWQSNDLAVSRGGRFGLHTGIEQSFFDRLLEIRAGLADLSPRAGVALRISPLRLDVCYAYDLAIENIGSVFGSHSHTVMARISLDYRALEQLIDGN